MRGGGILQASLGMLLAEAAVDEVTESPSYDRPKLLPSLGALGAMNVLAALIAHSPLGFFGVIVLSTGYLGVVILGTRDLVSNETRLHPTDRWLCRRSGVLAAGLAAALMAGVSLAVARDVELEAIGLESPWGLCLVGFAMEIGAVLCVACLWAPRNLRHTRPVILWKIVAVPLLVIYGAYVVLLLVTAAATMIAHE
jgi:hypothetical protein